MADNYLEKKYEALQQGKTVYRRNWPSLDMLLRACAESKAAPGHGYVVKYAQMEAMVRSADTLGYGFHSECSENSDGIGLIAVYYPQSDAPDRLSAGEYILALRLKAAELGLFCRVLSSREDITASSAVAVVEVLK